MGEVLTPEQIAREQRRTSLTRVVLEGLITRDQSHAILLNEAGASRVAGCFRMHGERRTVYVPTRGLIALREDFAVAANDAEPVAHWVQDYFETGVVPALEEIEEHFIKLAAVRAERAEVAKNE